MLFSKQPKIRRFTYKPFFYEPKEEIDEDEPRIKFRRSRLLQGRRKKRSTIFMFLLIIIILYMLFYLNRITKVDEESQFKNFKVEEVIVQ